MRITRKRVSACEDKNCPAIWDTDDLEMVAIQGAKAQPGDLAAAGRIPADEGFVYLPRNLLLQWAAGQS
jgi:hypothetical protein